MQKKERKEKTRKIIKKQLLAQSAGGVEYTDCFSVEE